MHPKNLILAGTFDHLHLGHQNFLSAAINQADSVLLGITTGSMARNKISPLSLQSFNQRLSSLKNFLKTHAFDYKVEIFPLHDVFGPSVANPYLNQLACTKDSYPNALLVNQKRKLSGLNPLELVKVDLVKAQDKQRISSSRIRLGEIDRQGLVYQQLLVNKSFFLPYSKRLLFKQPLAKIFLGQAHNLSWSGLQVSQSLKRNPSPLVITIGDITTQTFLLHQLPVDLAIIDNRSQRQPLRYNLLGQLKTKNSFHFKTKNQPGTISSRATQLISQSLKKIIFNRQKGLLQVSGEEDLLVLPAILLSPLKTVIFYGQPDKGLVQVKVTEKMKAKALQLIKLLK